MVEIQDSFSLTSSSSQILQEINTFLSFLVALKANQQLYLVLQYVS
jgi:hypothetical protein